MIELRERTRRISPTRIHEILLRYGAKSLVDPFMGLPTHLNYLKRHGIAVHGGDVLEWFVRVGEMRRVRSCNSIMRAPLQLRARR